MSKKKHRKTEMSHPPVEKEPKLLREDVDESQQEIQEAGYAVGLSRGNGNKDESDDWVEAEKEVEAEEED